MKYQYTHGRALPGGVRNPRFKASTGAALTGAAIADGDKAKMTAAEGKRELEAFMGSACFEW
jgi:hypothetical protein